MTLVAIFSAFFFLYTFVEYTFTDALKYTEAPGSFHGAQGGMAERVLLPRAQCVACQFPLFLMFVPCSPRERKPLDPLVVDSPAALAFNKAGVPAGAHPLSFNNLPRGQRLWRPELLTASFVRGTQPAWSGLCVRVRSLLKRMRFLNGASSSSFASFLSIPVASSAAALGH